MNLAEAEGYEMTKAEAEAYLAELADFELDNEMLENARAAFSSAICGITAVTSATTGNKDEAETYIVEFADVELDDETLK